MDKIALKPYDPNENELDARERLSSYLAGDFGGIPEEEIANPALKEIGLATAAKKGQRRVFAPKLKTADAVGRFITHIRFEVWRYNETGLLNSPYVYQSFQNAEILADDPAQEETTEDKWAYIRSTYRVLSALRGSPVTVQFNVQSSVKTTIAELLRAKWPLEQQMGQQFFPANAEMNAVFPDTVKIVQEILAWQKAPDTYVVNLVGDVDTEAEKQPVDIIPEKPPVVVNTTSSSSTTTKTGVTPPPKTIVMPPTQPSQQNVHSACAEEARKLREEKTLLEKRLKAVESNLMVSDSNIGSLQKRLKEAEDRGIANEEAHTEELMRKNAVLLKLKLQNDELRAQIQQGVDVGAATLLERGNRLDNIQIYRVKTTKNGRVEGVSNVTHDTLGTYQTGELDGLYLYEPLAVEQLIAAYNTGGGATLQLGQSELREQDTFRRLADKQLGSQRVLATFNDRAGNPYATIELSRLAPKQTQDLRRYLIADLQSESQSQRQGFGRRNEIPLDGEVVLQVYDQQGALVKEPRFNYSLDGTALKSKTLVRSNNDVRLYATTLSYNTARPDMIVIPY